MYRPLVGCEEETHLFCVPIPLPSEIATQLEAQLGAVTVPNCRLVACLASNAELSRLRFLREPAIAEIGCDIILFEVAALLRTIAKQPPLP